MTIETVTLNQLNLNKANPRKSIDESALEGLAASIATDGLLQNLVVRPRRGGKSYDIISGERRFRALNLLAERGEIETGFPIPVEIRKGLSKDEGLRIATVENVQREQLNPMDEAEAFAALMTKGADIADIAAKAGMTPTTVKRRLAIASICDEAKAAVRNGELPLSVAEALTLGTHAQQQTVMERMEQGYSYDGDAVRRMLTGEKPSLSIAVFDRARYDGTYTTDLFADEDTTYFDDAEQFFRLQGEAVEELAACYQSDGKSVEVLTDYHVSWWQYREAEEDENGGTVIHFAPSGRVEIRENLVRHDVKKQVVNEASESPAAPKPKPEYGKPLMRYMAAHKTLAVQEALLANPRKAKEVGVIQMMNAHDGAARIKLDAHPALAFFAEDADQPTCFTAIEEEAETFNACLNLDGAEAGFYGSYFRGAWERLSRTRKDAVPLYEAVGELTDAELDQLHCLLTVLTFGQGGMDEVDTADSLFNRIAADLEVDMQGHWRPDEAFLSRRRKDQLEAIANESGAAKRMGRLADYSKKQLVAALVKHFEACKDANDDVPEHELKGRDWLPDAMRFSVARVEDETEPEDSDAIAA
ncbi:ParB/RepB/Spo0J family partition protein [Pacificispira sp.]|uniref:ParB/RepB/Spo0J family partition protein n=1 Tax=Pacificispira sp. TaxID=2888761 RepID=UPI003B51C88C